MYRHNLPPLIFYIGYCPSSEKHVTKEPYLYELFLHAVTITSLGHHYFRFWSSQADHTNTYPDNDNVTAIN